MTTLEVVLAVAAAAAAIVAVLLALSRARLVAEAAGFAREREAAGAEAARVREENAAAAREADGLRVQAAGLARDLEAERRSRQEDAQHFNDTHHERMTAQEEQYEARIKSEAREHALMIQSAQQQNAQIKETLEGFEARAREFLGKAASDALSGTSKDFLALAEQKFAVKTGESAQELEKKRAAVESLVKPMADALAKLQELSATMEQQRTSAYAALREQVAAGTQGQAQLRAETARLVQALREPHVRGRYGEVQLKRVAELAGMSAFCDFTPQEQVRDLDGNPLRPDMVVKMPSGRQVVVDAKTNIQAYLDALREETTEGAEACMVKFARHVSEQATALARKKYWSQFDGSPEFVVMFIPGEQFIDAALAREGELFERAAAQGVILAGPSTLIGLLRAVAVGYQEQRLALAAEELRGLGRELHERAAVAFGHIEGLGAALARSVEKYNDFVGSYEKRLEPTLKKFEESGARSGKELAEIKVLEGRVRGVVGSDVG